MHYNEVVLENNIKKATKKPVITLDECSPLKAFVMFCEAYQMTGDFSATEGSEELETFGAMARIQPGKYVTMTVRKKRNEWAYTFTDVLDYLPIGTSFDLIDHNEEEEEDEFEGIRTVEDEKSGNHSCHACGTTLGKGDHDSFNPKPGVQVSDIYAGVSYDQVDGERVLEMHVTLTCPTCKETNVYETSCIIE